MQNTWFQEGQKSGLIIPTKEIYFQAVVSQEESFSLFGSKIIGGSLKLHGQTEKTIDIKSLNIIPFRKQELPSAALGWLGGGDIKVSQDDSSGTKTKESFFEVRANVIKRDDVDFFQGRSGVLKIELEPKNLVERLVITVKQVLQKHYKI